MSGDSFNVRGDGDKKFTLAGAITEATDFKPIVDAAADGAVLDLAAVDRINSCGVREWIHFLEALEKGGKHVVLENCAVPMVRQFNMIETATKGAQVRSIMLPYFCPDCDDERTVACTIAGGAKPALPAAAACEKCGAAMEFDDDESAYFAFFKG